MKNIREIVLKELLKSDKNEQYVNLTLKRNEKEHSKEDIAFMTRLFYGVLERKITLDYILDRHLKTGMHKLPKEVAWALRMGVYQLYYMDKVPSHAAVFETVELIKKRYKKLAPLVNGVLRSVEREDKEALFQKLEQEDRYQYLSVKYAVNEPMIKHWMEQFGEYFTESLCESFFQDKDMYLRLNFLKKPKEEILKELKEAGIEYADSGMEESVLVRDIHDISSLKPYQEGLIYIQGQSSTLAAKILDPKEGEHILDACSAPGGKTTHMAELMRNKGSIEAWDFHESRIQLVHENCKRLGVTIVKTKVMDAAWHKAEYDKKFDKVLLDVPCSNMGILGKRPDMKWKIMPKEVYNLSKLQYNILHTCANYVKQGGILVYSTCSIEPEENEEVVKRFLEANKEFVLEKIDLKTIPESFRIGQEKDYLKLYPHIHGTEGFFIAKIKRR